MTKKRRYSGQQKQPENSKKKNEKGTKNESKGDDADSPDHLSSTLSSALASCNSVLYGDILKDLYNPSDCDKMPKINENVDEPNDPEQNPPVSAMTRTPGGTALQNRKTPGIGSKYVLGT